MKDVENLVANDSEALLETITEKLPNSIWIIPADLEGGVKWISSAVSMQRGYTPEEVKNQTLEEIFTESSLQHVFDAVKEELQNEQDPNVDKNRVRVLELEMKCKDGSIIHTENHVSFLYDENGELKAFLGVTKDITDKKIATKRKELTIRILQCLNESDESLERTLEKITALIRENLKLVSVCFFDNSDCLTGLENEDFSKTEHGSLWNNSLVLIPVRIHQKIMGVMKMDAGNEHVFDVDLIEFLEDISISLGIAMDKDESRKKIEQQKEQLRHGQYLQSIGKLAAGIAHDFNNLLVPVVSGAEVVLLDDSLPDSVKDTMMMIKESGHRAARLVRSLLAFGRREQLVRESLDVEELLTELSKALEAIIGENINLNFSISADLRNIYFDKSQFNQVLMNLIINAKDAMPHGGDIDINVENYHIDEDKIIENELLKAGDYVCIRVSDAGIGIPEENIKRLFEPFFTTKPFHQGSGMGLSVVYGIVKQHGGHISVKSTVGEGTEFSLLLPVSDKASKKREKSSYVDRKIESKLEGKKIFVIEDDLAVQRMVARVLEKAGATVVKASTVAEAYEQYSQNGGEFDIIFSDVVLPDGNGSEVVINFKKKGYSGAILLTSGYPSDANVEGLSGDANIPFLQKPFGSSLTLIEKILSTINDNR